jgi:hypothetical protein
MKTMFATLFLLGSLTCSSAMAQAPRPRQRPQIPVVPPSNPQSVPVYYPAPAPAAPGPSPVYYPAAPGAPQMIATSNRCFIGPNAFAYINQFAPVGSGCWVTDVNGNQYNGTLQ